MKPLVILLAFQFLGLFLSAQTTKPTTIYLVRHAEKVTTDTADKNPMLTAKGIKRAQILSKEFKKINLTAIYSTDFNRTKLTAEPTAKKQKIDISIYNHKQIKAFALSLLEKHKGQNILVVGHSNSVIETIKALGLVSPVALIDESEYDYFFTITVLPNDLKSITVKRYGAKIKAN